MAEKANKNWERRDIDSRGSKFRIDVNNPQIGARGPNAWLQYGVTDEKRKQFTALSEDGTFMVHNEKSIEVVAGSENNGSDTTVKIASAKGDITITVLENGQIKIKGGSVIIQADDDINLKAGRNITLSAGFRVLLKGIKVDASGLLGNLVENTVGSFIQRVFNPTYVGADYLANPPEGDDYLDSPVVTGVGDEPSIQSFTEGDG